MFRESKSRNKLNFSPHLGKRCLELLCSKRPSGGAHCALGTELLYRLKAVEFTCCFTYPLEKEEAKSWRLSHLPKVSQLVSATDSIEPRPLNFSLCSPNFHTLYGLLLFPLDIKGSKFLFLEFQAGGRGERRVTSGLHVQPIWSHPTILASVFPISNVLGRV